MTADELLAAASALTGLHDFGDEAEYLPGLRKLLQAFDDDKVAFTTMGEQIAKGALVGPLAGRLHAVEGWKKRPDCLTRPITAPIIILGLPRTGTTALFHLLWLDPQFQGAEMWLIDAPMPRPPHEGWASHPAHQYSAASIAGLLAVAPGFAVAHPRDPDLPDECLDIIKQCFTTTLWGTMFPVPSYDAWWPQQDHVPYYRYLRRALQLIGADDRRRWLLKDPTSIMHLPPLFETFPDASVIVTHRDPAEVIASLCSLLRGLLTPIFGDNLDLQRVAEREIAFWSRGANALVDGVPKAQRRVDVQCKDFQAEPMRIVHGIYDQLGLSLSSEAEAAMLQHLADLKVKPREPHVYTREEFGLDVRYIRDRFAPYIAHFNPMR